MGESCLESISTRCAQCVSLRGVTLITSPRGWNKALLTALLVAGFTVAIAAAPSSTAKSKSPAAGGTHTTPTHYLPNRFAGRAGMYYRAVWGVDSLSVKWAESGEMIRFAWRVLDPDKAKVLNDKKAEPALIDPRAGVSLVIPAMENVGQLRQSGPPEAGKGYWMAFSNKGRLVKRGDRINVVIGPFRAEGLVVD
jgi:hypothetical protein